MPLMIGAYLNTGIYKIAIMAPFKEVWQISSSNDMCLSLILEITEKIAVEEKDAAIEQRPDINKAI
jgi:hypothetical protein